jgi:signal transduction histidine kinase
LQLSVYDQGDGIPLELREKIFEPFFSTKPKDKGTGLGLSISHGIIKEHYGTLTVRSIENQFTDVTVEFPIYKAQSNNTQGALNG